MADKLKLSVALLILLGAIGAFYYFADQSLLVRVVGILVAVVVALLISAQTGVGRAALAFLRDARTEARKVVWPTRKETMQTTLIVMVMVVVVGIMLWLLDMVLLWAVKALTQI